GGRSGQQGLHRRPAGEVQGAQGLVIARVLHGDGHAVATDHQRHRPQPAGHVRPDQAGGGGFGLQSGQACQRHPQFTGAPVVGGVDVVALGQPVVQARAVGGLVPVVAARHGLQPVGQAVLAGEEGGLVVQVRRVHRIPPGYRASMGLAGGLGLASGHIGKGRVGRRWARIAGAPNPFPDTAMRRFAFLFALLLAAMPALGQDRRTDEHSYAQPDKVRITDLALDLRLDFDQRQLAGEAVLSLAWQDPDARELVLDTRDLRIDKVSGRNGDGRWRALDFELAPRDERFGSKLTISMRKQYEQVRVVYATSPEASGLQWLAPTMTAGRQLPFMFSQSQAIHARSWVPLQDTPSVRFTYSARIRTRPDVMVLMSADNDPAAERDGDYSFRMPQPIPSYLLAIAAGDLVFKPISERAGVWAEPQTVDAAVREFEDTEKMIQVTESLYGPYRWERYDLLILPPSFPFG